jgi:ADP-ribose pyrophosphatase
MHENDREIRLSTETIFEGRVLRLEVDRVRLPGGGESTREVVRHRGAAVILPILDDGRLLFVRQYRYVADERLLELPAGTVEPGEPVRRCADREVAEETGRAARRLEELGSFFAAPGYTDELLHAFAATELERAVGVQPDPDELIEVEALSVREAFDAVEAGRIRDSKTLSTLLLARLKGLI